MPERHQHQACALVRGSADDKLNARLIVSRILLDTVEALPCATPNPTPRGAASSRCCANSWRHEFKA